MRLMNEKLSQRMADPKVAHDTRLLGDFAVIYCRGNHAGRPRRALVSDGASSGVYGKRPPEVCDDCADLLRYAEKRRAFCPKDPKPFCSHCDTHCYSAEMREAMREVMRYAGPRSVLRGHAIDSVKHAIEGRRTSKRASGRSPGSDGTAVSETETEGSG